MVEQIHPEPMLQFFAYDHLPSNLQMVSREFYELACIVAQTLPRNPERTVALRKLLEAKDCAVRAAIYKDDTGATARAALSGEPFLKG
jgi:ferritin-like protein